MTHKRRDFLKKVAAAGLGLVTAKAFAGTTTPSQTEGPFFPVHDALDTDADLTLISGREQVALGDVVLLDVVVLDRNDQPIEGAIVNLWQACWTGRYLHPQDPNTSAELDENFQYRAKLVTNAEGRISVKTIKPGVYPATETWDRPPHLHFQVDVWGEKQLTTQMYFAGEALNDEDRILAATRAEFGNEAADGLIVDFALDELAVAPRGQFTIRLASTPPSD